MSPDEAFILVGFMNGTLIVVDSNLVSPTVLYQFGPEHAVVLITFDATYQCFWICTSKFLLTAWDVNSLKQLLTLKLKSSSEIEKYCPSASCVDVNKNLILISTGDALLNAIIPEVAFACLKKNRPQCFSVPTGGIRILDNWLPFLDEYRNVVDVRTMLTPSSDPSSHCVDADIDPAVLSCSSRSSASQMATEHQDHVCAHKNSFETSLYSVFDSGPIHTFSRGERQELWAGSYVSSCLFVYDVGTRKITRSWLLQCTGISCITRQLDNIWAGTKEGLMYAWHTETHVPLFTICFHSDMVRCFASQGLLTQFFGTVIQAAFCSLLDCSNARNGRPSK